MARFLALTSKGLGGALEHELRSLDIKNATKKGVNVEFDSSWKDLYRIHLQSRIASRILLPILDFEAYNADDLYKALFKKHDFTKYITPDQTLSIDANVFDHRELRDQRFVAQKSKDAIVDQFRNKFDKRPDVDSKNPDLKVVVRVHQTKISVAIDLTGTPLSFRGYRSEAGEAPLRENLAAGLVDLCDWDEKTPLIDPMCGAGTILIEAALKARGGILPRRDPFLFQRLKNFDPVAYSKAQTEAASFLKMGVRPPMFGFDSDPKAIAAAKANAKRAQVADYIHFEVQPIQKLVAPPVEKGWIVSNPPYAIRLGDQALGQKTWEDLAHTLKTQFSGWSCWFLSGNKEVSSALHLKTSRKIPLMNGPIECRFLHYQLH